MSLPEIETGTSSPALQCARAFHSKLSHDILHDSSCSRELLLANSRLLILDRERNSGELDEPTYFSMLLESPLNDRFMRPFVPHRLPPIDATELHRDLWFSGRPWPARLNHSR